MPGLMHQKFGPRGELHLFAPEREYMLFIGAGPVSNMLPSPGFPYPFAPQPQGIEARFVGPLIPNGPPLAQLMEGLSIARCTPRIYSPEKGPYKVHPRASAPARVASTLLVTPNWQFETGWYFVKFDIRKRPNGRSDWVN